MVLRKWLLIVVALLAYAGWTETRTNAQALPLARAAGTLPFDAAQNGFYSTAAVELDGVPLFRVASPANLKDGELSAIDRAMLVDAALQQIVATDRHGWPSYDASTLHVWTQRAGNEMTVQAADAHHSPLVIVTVTSVDAKYQESAPENVAASWATTLHNALVDALRKREPTVERANLAQVLRIAAGLAASTVLLLLVLRSLQRRMNALADELGESDSSSRSSTVHELRAFSAAFGAISWLIALLWFVGATWAFGLFSQTTALSRSFSRGGTAIGIIWIGFATANLLCDFLIARAAARWRIQQYLSSEERARVLLRVPTAARAIAHFKTVVLIMVAVVLTLGELGLPVASVVTIGGVVAIAITFGAQNVLRDVAGGIAVLYEDQYAIGDFVTINGQTGLVEQVTLRMVMIRDLAGSVVTISHSAVTSVSNYSRVWSRIDYKVSIAAEANPKAAIEAIVSSVEELAKEPEVAGSLKLPIEWIGVDAFSNGWTLIRASIRTAPLQQFTLRRALNSRVRHRLGEAGIAFGPPIEAQHIPLF